MRKNVSLTGVDLLRNSSRNKSTAFTEEERDKFKLRGLLPAYVGTMETQIERVLANLRRKESDIEKYIFLSALHDRNERLFFRLVIENFKEILPSIYTPTVGQACKEFANIFRTEKGFYVTSNDQGKIRQILNNWPHTNIRIIVITDGERILGLGDLGANGMGIPIGKLWLYCACAGIPPEQCLPVMFDVGTNNSQLLKDPVYLGIHGKRICKKQYHLLMDEFISAAQDAFPGVLIQFEDFNAINAYTLLNKYRDKILCFNDDIQGTAAVVLAGIYASTRISGKSFTDLKFTFVGAGSAATGIGSMIAQALISEGLNQKEAYQRLWFFNRTGLIHSGRLDLADYVKPFAHNLPNQSLIESMHNHQPDILIGATGSSSAFSENVVKLMARLNERPGIFALSNPTSRAECTAEQAYRWTDGRAIFASGSPFEPVKIDGNCYRPSQGNNSYIFPGIGLGMISCRAKTIPDSIFLESARVLSESVSESDLEHGSIYPDLNNIRKVSLNIAIAVAKFAYSKRLTDQKTPKDVRKMIHEMIYEPKYQSC